MVDRIGNGGSLAREAILAAMKSQAQEAQRIRDAAAELTGTGTERPRSAEQPEVSFADRVQQSLEAVEGEIQKAEGLPQDMVVGKVQDFHEVAVQLKQADLSFKFALEIRNKLVDAYREVMRMTV